MQRAVYCGVKLTGAHITGPFRLGDDCYMSLPLLFSVGEKKLGFDLIIEQQCVLKNQSTAKVLKN